jgi:hypothetical protein
LGEERGKGSTQHLGSSVGRRRKPRSRLSGERACTMAGDSPSVWWGFHHSIGLLLAQRVVRQSGEGLTTPRSSSMVSPAGAVERFHFPSPESYSNYHLRSPLAPVTQEGERKNFGQRAVRWTSAASRTEGPRQPATRRTCGQGRCGDALPCGPPAGTTPRRRSRGAQQPT